MLNKKRKIRFGIFGTGWMADTFAKELTHFPHTKIVGVASGTKARATSFVKKHPTAKAFASFEALADCDEVDAIYIATTNDRHFENAKTCIERDKAVLVEKPVALSIEETQRLVSLASARNVFLMEAMWMHCFPVIRNLEETLAPIGEIRNVEVSFCIDVPFEPNHRLYNPALGGGALLDIGIYPLHLIHRLWGFADTDMTCRLKRAPTGTDESGIVTFNYSDGRRARLDYSLNGLKPHRAVFKGTMGNLTLDDFFHPSKLKIETEAAPPRIQTFTYPMMGYHYEIEEVVKCLWEGRIESDLVPLSVSLEIISMMDRILGSPVQ